MSPSVLQLRDSDPRQDRTALWSVAMTDSGLVCGAGSVLARMAGRADGTARLALDTDKGRLLAMLSVVTGEPVSAAKILHHVEAAAAHWQRGDKALANLRLVFARLPRPGDTAAVERLALTERLLDEGLAPGSLMKALWPQPVEDGLRRYDPAQPRVPAGHGVESGRWEFADGSAGDVRFDDGRIVVAANAGEAKGGSLEEEKLFEERDREGIATPEEEVAHGRGIDPLAGLPRGVARGSWSAIDAAARDALTTVGPGQGPNYGTAVHTQMRDNIRALKDPNLSAEQSYLNGKLVKYGTKGAIRIDVIEGPAEKPRSVHDLKTGSATLTLKRIEQIRTHVPDGRNIPIREIKP